MTKGAPGPPGYQEEMGELGQARCLVLLETFTGLTVGVQSVVGLNLGELDSHRAASFGTK